MGWMRTPAKFTSALGLSVVAAFIVSTIVFVLILMLEKGGKVLDDLIIILLTISLSIFIIIPLFWYAAKRKMGYIWS